MIQLYSLNNEFIEETSSMPQDNFTGIIEFVNGSREWWFNGERHRLDGPAIVWHRRYEQWFLYGKRHRLTGPAIEWSDGTKTWYIHGMKVSEKEHKLLAGILKLKGLL